jgi:hypothetical protein
MKNYFRWCPSIVNRWVTLPFSENSFLIYKFKGAGNRGVNRLAAADHLQLVTKSENACRHTFYALVELRSNVKKKKKKLQIIAQIYP